MTVVAVRGKNAVAEPCTLSANCCKRLIRSFDSYAAEILSEAMSLQENPPDDIAILAGDYCQRRRAHVCGHAIHNVARRLKPAR